MRGASVGLVTGLAAVTLVVGCGETLPSGVTGRPDGATRDAALSVDSSSREEGGRDARVADTSTRSCAPGEEIACVCPGTGSPGVQVCASSGDGYAACSGCASFDAGSPTDGNAASDDAPVPGDAGLDVGPGTDGDAHGHDTGAMDASATISSSTFTVAAGFGAIIPVLQATCADGDDGGRTPCQVLAVFLSNRADMTCDKLIADQGSGQRVEFANEQLLELSVVTNSGYVAPETLYGNSYFLTTSSTCVAGPYVNATSGTVTISQLTATEARGSYSMTYGSQGSLSGPFDVTLCVSPDAGAGPSADAGIVCTP